MFKSQYCRIFIDRSDFGGVQVYLSERNAYPGASGAGAAAGAQEGHERIADSRAAWKMRHRLFSALFVA